MLRGDIVITNNLDAVPIYGTTHKLVFLHENKQMSDQYGAIHGSILLPPYEAVSAEMDNNLEAFYGYYYAHLNNYEASRMVSAIIAALYQGINICLYVPNETKELRFNVALVEYFANSFGILVGVDQPVMYCDYNTSANAALNVLTLLYSHDHLSVEDLFSLYPQGLPIMESILPKLIQEFDVQRFNSLPEYAQYFFDYKETIKANNNVFLHNAVIFEG
jgi:hypothetical protein